MTIEPDTKDWTWVLREPCPECGFVATDLDRGDLGRLIRDDATGWVGILRLPDAATRPDPHTWSPLEYACHVRDVHRVFGERLVLMLDQDEPLFANWDQDATAVEDRYDAQDPAAVATELLEAASAVADRYDALLTAPAETWDRRGLRSNGSEFTVDTLARYHLHDIVHHAHDVRDAAARATIAAYDANADGYRQATSQLDEQVRLRLDAFAAAVGAGGRVLEIGSGSGRHARELEARGLVVERTDITPAFVEQNRADGFEARLLDPLTGELGGPHDGVWSNACLLHVARPDLPRVLARLADATREGGLLGLSLKEGDGEGWSTHGTVTAPRRFVYWREGPLRDVLAGAGWQVVELATSDGLRDEHWLMVLAKRVV